MVRRFVILVGSALVVTACGSNQAEFKTPPPVVVTTSGNKASPTPSGAASFTPGPIPGSSSAAVSSIPPVPIQDVAIAPVSALADTGVIGFAVTLDPADATATVGPGWAVQGGSLVPVYAGGTVSLPPTVAGGMAPSGTPWPVLMAVANTGSWSTATSATVAVTIPEQCGPGPTFAYPLTACPTGPDGQGPPVNLTDAVTRLAVVGESFQFYVNGTLEQETYPRPTWLLYQNTDPHVTWSGGSIGSGAPTYNP